MIGVVVGGIISRNQEHISEVKTNRVSWRPSNSIELAALLDETTTPHGMQQ